MHMYSPYDYGWINASNMPHAKHNTKEFEEQRAAEAKATSKTTYKTTKEKLLPLRNDNNIVRKDERSLM